MNSWKTSVIGVVLILGAIASLGISALVNKRAPTADELMVAGGAIATGIGLINARDNDKSSEIAGAHFTPRRKRARRSERTLS